MGFQRKHIYEKYKKTDYSELHDKSLFDFEIDFSKDNIKKMINEQKFSISNCRVWLLFAIDEDNKWECLQVGQSKNNVKSEIKTLLEYLLIDKKNVVPQNNSAFYESVCPGGSKELYRKNLYSMIGQNFSQFKICSLNVNRYLGIKQSQALTDADHIIEICKNQYAEAKIALETLAVYWRLYSAGIDGQTIAYIIDNKEIFGLECQN